MTPREPVSRVFRHGRGMSLQRHGVIERVERASVDQAQVDVPDPRSVERFIAQRVFAMEDGRLERALHDVVVQGRTRDREEPG